ncbi:hypothetical protein K7X08_020713 [Anisodus acutangulus]|uniref:Uncharacterized protein n=1 Tax=Anisodus acutangulus TaxID=402998 RepID=A0A9Q1RRD8_9SOLA|nr:hypothetical protein K7X08_020713 [Anisodus acutangulus]
MARFLVSSLNVDDSSSKAGAMISYSEVSKKKNKNKPKSIGTCASNIDGAGSLIMYSGGAGGGDGGDGGACCGGC